MATTTSTTAVAGAASAGPGFPPFNTATFASQLIWLAIAFGALYLVMSRVLAPRLTAIVDGRAERIEGDLATASSARDRAGAALKAYETSLQDAAARAQAIATETRARMAAEADASRKAMEADLATKLTQAEAQIASTKASAMANVEAVAIEAAQAIVERLTGTAPAAALIAGAVKGATRS